MSADYKAFIEQMQKPAASHAFLRVLINAALSPATTLVISVGSAGGKKMIPKNVHFLPNN